MYFRRIYFVEGIITKTLFAYYLYDKMYMIKYSSKWTYLINFPSKEFGELDLFQNKYLIILKDSYRI